jgi:hypothetical protein
LDVDLVSNPDLLARRKDLAAKAAVWYWTTNNIGPVADRGDFRGVCRLINRGENPPQGPIPDLVPDPCHGPPFASRMRAGLSPAASSE